MMDDGSAGTGRLLHAESLMTFPDDAAPRARFHLVAAPPIGASSYPELDLDAWIVMPDHLHGIVFCGTDPDATRNRTVGEAIRWFKASVVEGWRIGVRDHGWPRYERHLWQRDFHDRILRTHRELASRQHYIEGNPGRWWEKYGGGS